MSIQNQTDPARKTDAPLLRDILYALKYFLGGRRGLVLAAMAIGGGGLLLNWSWLVAVGLAPLLLALLPCAAMCALGMCMSHGKGKDDADATGGHCCADRDDGNEPDDTRSP
jgi:hypothetical protein